MGQGWANGHARMLRELQLHGNVLRACRETGVRRATFYRWQDEDPAYKTAVREATAIGHRGMYDSAVDHYYSVIEEGEPATAESLRVAANVLKSLRPEIWGEKSRMELSGPGGAPIEVETKDVSDKPAIVSEALEILRSLGFGGRHPDPGQSVHPTDPDG